MATTTTLDTLVINYLTQAQYDAAQQAGTLNANQLYLTPDTSSGGGGTLSSIGISNATNGGLSVSGSPLTSDGSITIGHSNVLTSAQTTQAVYPIAIDKNGHISSYGSAVTINPKTTWYGTSSTAAGTQTKSVTCSGFTLETGAVVCVTFTYANTYASAKIMLNVNSTGAKDVYYNNAATSSTNTLLWKAGETVIFVYSGSYFYFAGKSANKLSAFVNDSGFITSADVPEGSSAYTGTISAVGTTASSGSNNGFARGDHVHNITSSTITSALGYTPGTSSTDENLKWTASTTSNTYYPLVSTSTATTSTANTLNGISYYQYYNTTGGYRRLDLGNSTAYKSSGGAYGTIRLYGAAATYYGDLVPGVLGTTSGDGHISANRTWTLPDKTGTIALTSDITDENVKIEDTTTNTDYEFLVVLQQGSGTITTSIKKFLNATLKETSTTTTLTVGSSLREGQLGLGKTVGNTQYITTLVPSHTASRTITLPDKTGTIALTSDIPTVPSITLNGSSTTSPSFYAPTSAGTSGYYLKSNGSGAPSWAAITDSDEKVKIETISTNSTYKLLGAYLNSTSTVTTTIKQFYDVTYVDNGSVGTLTIGPAYTGNLALGKPVGDIAYTTTIQPSHTTSRTITLPDANGTVVVVDSNGNLNLNGDINLTDGHHIYLNSNTTNKPYIYAGSSTGDYQDCIYYYTGNDHNTNHYHAFYAGGIGAAYIRHNGFQIGSSTNNITLTVYGDVNITGSYKVSNSTLLKVVATTKDNISITASTTGSGTFTVTSQSGYTPVGIVGFDCSNATSSGTGIGSCVPLQFELNGSTVSWQMRNNSSSAAKIAIQVFTLYAKTGLI